MNPSPPSSPSSPTSLSPLSPVSLPPPPFLEQCKMYARENSHTPRPRNPTNHPPYLEMITDAIVNLKKRNGSSQQAIAKYIEEKYQYNLPKNYKTFVWNQLKKAVADGKLVKVKASFKLPPKNKPVRADSSVPAKKKPAAKSKMTEKKVPAKKKATAAAPKSKAPAKPKAKAPAPKGKPAAKPSAAAKPKTRKKPAAKSARTSTRSTPGRTAAASKPAVKKTPDKKTAATTKKGKK